ncbi:TonB-dependent receptor domain-containing protein [Pseudohongiella acticola]|mgnify:CR=1 FL=1|jgi:iron complex outermembrane recepter protein|uniref:TonB-dependent receptor domain-containing protein n=1 Tax=Pseudohongiella acticola TaxID=1524254 RepID=UPI0030EF3C60
MKLKKSIVQMGLAASVLLPLPMVAVAQQGAAADIEEVVVTGSRIRRDSFDSSSPVTVVDSAAIEANATPNLGEVLANQTFNYGTDVQTNGYAARGQGGVTSSANLRGLGAGATLNLVDGQRTNNTNLNATIPQIAIARIDILKDGASALYGSDAVAGVVNVITNKGYEGTDVSIFHQEDRGGDLVEKQYELITGTATDNGHFAMALSYSTRSTLEQTDRPEFLRSGFQRSGTGNPGTFAVPTRNATGQLTGASARTPDPGCGIDNGSGTDVGIKGSYASGQLLGTTCNFHFGEFWDFMSAQDKMSLWTNYEHRFNDNLTNDFNINASRLETFTRGSPQNPGGRIPELPVVAGEHPGNPYRAMANRGNGMEPLYAQAGPDGNPLRNANGVVQLASDPFNPALGIPFNEDVRITELRINAFKLQTQPTAVNDDGAFPQGADRFDIRLADTLTYEMPGTSWAVSLAGVYQFGQDDALEKNSSQLALIQGINGTLVADPSSPDTTAYYNPFASSVFNCTNRVCANTGTPQYANSQAVVDAITIAGLTQTESTFKSVELAATGEVFEIPTGMILGAFGVEFRQDEVDVDFDAARNQCDYHQGGCAVDYTAEQDVSSAFFELAVPLTTNRLGEAEFQIAGRYTDYGGSIGDSFDPKVALLWQPMDILSLRGSWSSAFIAPGLADLYSPQTCALQNAGDPFDNSNAFRVACNEGNLNLTPETADVFNVGASLSLLEGSLSIGVDYAEYDFKDRISSTTLNQVVNLDYQAFLAAGGNPASQASKLAWFNGPNSDKNINRDVDGVMSRVIVSRLNAQTMKHRALDLYARYDLDLGSFGNMVFNLDGTQALEYSYDLGLGIPAGDGVGSQNEAIAEVPPMPEFRVNATMNWNLGNHSALLRARWIDGFEYSFNSGALLAGQIALNGRSAAASMTYIDANYAYTFDSLIGDRATRFEVGARNLGDRYPEPFFNLGGIETFVHDIRGRMMYIRINQEI